jgi:hypothetical protein
MQQPGVIGGETYVPIGPNPKYQTKMSARVTYLGAPFKNDYNAPTAPYSKLPETMTISPVPTRPMPIAAASAAIQDSPKQVSYLRVKYRIMLSFN